MSLTARWMGAVFRPRSRWSIADRHRVVWWSVLGGWLPVVWSGSMWWPVAETDLPAAPASQSQDRWTSGSEDLQVQGPEEASSVAGQAIQLAQITEVVARAQQRLKAVKDFTAVFHIQEYKGGQLPPAKMALRWRRTPRSIYLRSLDGSSAGQEAVWRADQNDGEMTVRLVTFPYLTLSLDPNGLLAMRESRHPITQIGFDRIVDLMVRDVGYAQRHSESPRMVVLVQGPQAVMGSSSFCYVAFMDKDNEPSFYGREVRVCLDQELALPNFVQIYDREDGDVRLIEQYGYESILVNTGLRDQDFLLNAPSSHPDATP